MANVAITGLELAIAADNIVFVQGEVTGNIWMANGFNEPLSRGRQAEPAGKRSAGVKSLRTMV